jgi:hypothetical protein
MGLGSYELGTLADQAAGILGIVGLVATGLLPLLVTTVVRRKDRPSDDAITEKVA